MILAFFDTNALQEMHKILNKSQHKQQKAEDNKKALRKSQQVKLTTIRTEPMLKINPNGLPPIANSAKIRKKTCKNSQNPREKLEHV
ncbi:hypothetical protein HMPREF1580_01323 [Gardnerella vaginalis JCP8070]|nr:hypothetical protein HMPREF1580_01323 [Gardnerella vaginalis JCP8070]